MVLNSSNCKHKQLVQLVLPNLVVGIVLSYISASFLAKGKGQKVSRDKKKNIAKIREDKTKNTKSLDSKLFVIYE